MPVIYIFWSRSGKKGFRKNKTEMSPADLNNTATDDALFNQYTLKKIMADFQRERSNTLNFLESFNEEDFLKSLYHPLLQQPMRIIDLTYFVAEHDIHHLKSIQHIKTILQ